MNRFLRLLHHRCAGLKSNCQKPPERSAPHQVSTFWTLFRWFPEENLRGVPQEDPEEGLPEAGAFVIFSCVFSHKSIVGSSPRRHSSALPPKRSSDLHQQVAVWRVYEDPILTSPRLRLASSTSSSSSLPPKFVQNFESYARQAVDRERANLTILDQDRAADDQKWVRRHLRMLQ